MCPCRYKACRDFIVRMVVYALAFHLIFSLVSVYAAPLEDNFIVYYGTDEVELLKLFDVAILSPLVDESSVKNLRNSGVEVLGYVSVASVGGWEPWIAGEELPVLESRGGVFFVNVCSPLWKEIIVDRAVPYVLNRGFRGVFFDDLDVADLYPSLKACISAIIWEVRTRYPNITIAVNRGFAIIEQIAPVVDYVLFEAFTSYFDSSSGKYKLWSGGDARWIDYQAQRLQLLSNKYGFKVLALSYADLSNSTLKNKYEKILNEKAAKYGFIPYLTSVSLLEINLDYAKMRYARDVYYGKKVWLSKDMFFSIYPV